MENEGEQKLGAAIAGEDGGVGKEGRKRKQATGAEEVEEEPTAAKKMKLEGERGGEGEEGLKQEAEEQVCEEEKKEVKLPEESDEVEEKEKEKEGETNETEEIDGPQPKLGTIADDGGGILSLLPEKKPYEYTFCYQKGKQLYEGQFDTTEDDKSTFRLNVEMHLDSGEVFLSLVLRPIPGSSLPPLTPYEFQVALVGEEGEDKGGCAMSVLSPQENEGPKVERKELVGDPALEFLRQRCDDGKEIVFRVEELASK